jgi:hypothetical protein
MMGRLIPCGGVLKSAFYTEAVVLGGMAALQGGHAKGVMF